MLVEERKKTFEPGAKMKVFGAMRTGTAVVDYGARYFLLPYFELLFFYLWSEVFSSPFPICVAIF